MPNQDKEKHLFIAGLCYPRQNWLTVYKPFVFPNVEELNKTAIEYPLDFLSIKDEMAVYGCGNNRIVLEFKKIVNKEDKDEHCYTRKLTIGSSKMLDSKQEKAAAYDIVMPVSQILKLKYDE